MTVTPDRRGKEGQEGRPSTLAGRFINPDLSITTARPPAAGGGTAVLIAPVTLALPMPEVQREVYLELRLRATCDVVTVIELLSPGNKRAGSDGRREYLEKRRQVLQTPAHLVELDLLRGGEPLPMAEPLPAADYYAFVSRARERPFCPVWPIGLRQPLPEIPSLSRGTTRTCR